MGQALQRAAQWTSAKGGSGGKLEFTKLNEELLNTIIQWIEGFGAKYPEEAKLNFKSPLTWPSSLRADMLSGAGYTEKGEEVVSEAQNDKGDHPLLVLKKSGSQDYMISILSLEYAEAVLRLASDKKLSEVRSCLEANRDPVVNMLGDRFATVEGDDNSIFRFIEEITKEIETLAKQSVSAENEGNTEKQGEIEMKKSQLKLRLQLLRLDQQLLNQSIVSITKDVRLTPVSVDGEVSILKDLSGEGDDKCVLDSIEYFGDGYIFKNGCRAQPWRQLHGDICYLIVKPRDGDTMYITANTSGYYLNNGLDPVKAGELNYTKVGDSYKDLVTLLKDKSPRFGELIDKQEFALKVRDRDHDHAVDHGGETRSYTEEDDYTHRTATKHQEKKDKDQKEDKQKQNATKKKKLSPSLKWKALGMEEYNEDEKKDKEKRILKKKRTPTQLKSKTPMGGEDSFSESSTESEEEEESIERRSETNADLPSEYWQIQKLVKYLKGGNQTATIIALCSMRDFNLAQETCQLAIRDVGGLEVLINLLDTEEIKCKIGSLKILKEISRNTQIRRAIADLGGLQTMVKILRDLDKDLKCLAAETIANVAKFRRARRTVRQHGGIKKLVGLLDCPNVQGTLTPDMEKDVEVARCGALALWSCSKSKKNKEAMRKAGAIPLLAKLLKSTHENMLIPVVGTLQECASEPSYRLAIRTEGMIEDLVKNLNSSNQELQMHCASAIFKCAEEKETRDLVRQYGGLDPLVALLASNSNKELLAAATGAIWKCSISAENVKRFQELKAIDLLVALLNDQPEEVLVNVVGALGELAKDPPNRAQIRKAGGISPLVNLLTGTNQALLVNVTKAVGQCAEEQDNMAIIDKLDGVRLLWSLLKNHNPEVQASAAWAICPCIENAKTDDKLQRHLAEAIARCCNWGNNRVAFGREKAVAPLVHYLKKNDEMVHRSTARALFQLSKDPENCITMHEAGAVQPLMKMVGSVNEDLQESAAGCIGNIRRLALANEKARYS
ncbi:hypothetical protein ACJMK2_014960 [Sinanodonta woodiana]|uniref:Armadillo repeat-containing protein 4 n=1 Tax=Sinanodonta woodiana TaxID=1069815 RepID=A0ABD3V4N8_SINWO